MSKKELVLRALNNETPERVPVGFWLHYLKDELEDLFKNPGLLDINLAGHKKFYNEVKPDFLKIMTDGFFMYPNEIFLNASKVSELKNIASIGEHHPWIEKQVEFAKTLTAQFGGEVLTFYNIFSPATIFRFGRLNKPGVSPGALLADFIAEDKETVIRAMNTAAGDLAVLARRVISEAGVDGLYYSSQDVNDPRVTGALHAEVIAPADFKVLEAAKTAAKGRGCYNILHICGYAGHRNNLSHFAEYPVQVFNWASTVEGVSLKEGKKLFGCKPVIGGFDNTVDGVLYKGTRAEIEAETERLIKDVGKAGVILGADCTIPRDTDLQHLQWIRDKAAAL
ncbi:MAG: uroporphyrinogen decarboxylase [Spirochaetaceae bacterium]|jgi:uroporphyrinogen decarboxylase|nr:uroporphyrinogen decarboxylase [Spirochaetaceae bacterium]